MKIKIKETFWRYPVTGKDADGKDINGPSETFHAGQTVEVSDADGALFIDKGHAVAITPEHPAPAPTFEHQ